MAFQVVMGAMLQCSFGASPCSLVVAPTNKVLAGNVPAATINDYIPITNIPSFGMCSNPANPAVAAATSAAAGVLTPQACVPATASPWTTGATTVLIGNIPALNDSSTCMCSYGGTISITSAGQSTVNIP